MHHDNRLMTVLNFSGKQGLISSVKTDLKVKDEITLFPGKIRNSHQAIVMMHVISTIPSIRILWFEFTNTP